MNFVGVGVIASLGEHGLAIEISRDTQMVDGYVPSCNHITSAGFSSTISSDFAHCLYYFVNVNRQSSKIWRHTLTASACSSSMSPRLMRDCISSMMVLLSLPFTKTLASREIQLEIRYTHRLTCTSAQGKSAHRDRSARPACARPPQRQL